MAIDAVFTWVDGSDPAHAEKREKYLYEAAKPRRDATASTRFADDDELFYSIRLLRQNCKWVDKIHIVTDAQIPKWLDSEARERFKINVVDHREIFSGFEHCLPTFSSPSIETMLFALPDCANKILYLNDDFFIVREAKANDFFTAKGPVFRGAWALRPGRVRNVLKRLGLEDPVGLAAYRGGSRIVGKTFKVFRRGHAPIPLYRDEMERIFTDNPVLSEHISYRFRATDQIQPMDIFINCRLAGGRAIVSKSDWRYIDGSEAEIEDMRDELDHINTNKSIKTLCVQSLDAAEIDAKELLVKQLEDWLR